MIVVTYSLRAIQNGLPQCGWKTTHALAQHGVGEKLLHAIATMSEDDLTQFIQGPYVKHVHELLAEMGHKNRRCWVLSEDFPNDFPSPAIVLAYVKPSTMVTMTHTQAAGDASSHCPFPLSNKSHPTDPEQLAFLCEFHYFGWSRGGPPGPVHTIESSGTLGKLKRLVWEGLCIHALCDQTTLSHGPENEVVKLMDSSDNEELEVIELMDSSNNKELEVIELMDSSDDSPGVVIKLMDSD
ncbi:hypothetical protein PAXRUDRAFT_27288 [Paxillus rubicundulus Ve08.2h10]|uniref:Uncharacterized protein n=1 Tax=Paxillus rubicundulus Ve08.2h10 TaxID=930991 RepID=A0A0D0DRY1_9AGAM|nr:hypothetical protein PAXRUDRAFT_27288 [Paxillus rubicundulus Ve08.2h10]